MTPSAGVERGRQRMSDTVPRTFTAPLYGESAFLLVIDPDVARPCPLCGSAHAIFVVRQVGADITHACAPCDGQRARGAVV
jgi:hypothetical protein